MQDGRRWAVDVDLEQFFDGPNIGPRDQTKTATIRSRRSARRACWSVEFFGLVK